MPKITSEIVRCAQVTDGTDFTVWSNYGTLGREGETHEPEIVVMGNGAFASTRSLGSYVGAFLDAATQADRAVTVVGYEDASNRKAYTLSQRVHALGTTVVSAAEMFGRPVHLVGHSWGAVPALNVARAFSGESEHESDLPLVASLTLLTPIAYSGEQTPCTLGVFLAQAAREVLDSKDITRNSLRTSAVLTLNALRRFLRAPNTMIQAAKQAFQADQMEVMRFHAPGSEFWKPAPQHIPLKAVVAAGDRIFPADPATAHLAEQGFEAHEIPGTHISAITDPANARRLFEVMFGRRD